MNHKTYICISIISRLRCSISNRRNGKVVRMTALIVTGDDEDKLQRPQWRPGQSPWRHFRFCDCNLSCKKQGNVHSRYHCRWWPGASRSQYMILSLFSQNITASGPNGSTHWGRDKKAVFSQTTFSNAFSWMKIYEFSLRFHWRLFLKFKLTISQHWFR